MAGKKIIWTKRATYDKFDILDYWIYRTKSKSFRNKLNKLFIEALVQISTHPYSGKLAELDNIIIKIVRSYLIFYKINPDGIQEEMMKN
jgi:toxin YoeB